MAYALDDLTPPQRRLLGKLGIGGPLDAIGCEMAELSDDELVVAHDMIPFGLIEIEVGWRETVWFSLTGAAQRIVREDLAK